MLAAACSPSPPGGACQPTLDRLFGPTSGVLVASLAWVWAVAAMAQSLPAGSTASAKGCVRVKCQDVKIFPNYTIPSYNGART